MNETNTVDAVGADNTITFLEWTVIQEQTQERGRFNPVTPARPQFEAMRPPPRWGLND